MDTARMARPIGSTAAVVCLCLTLAFDSHSLPADALVAYIGSWTAETDPSFRRFALAMQALEAGHARRITIRYVPTDALNPASVERGIASALSMKPVVLVAPTGDAAKFAVRKSGATAVVFASHVDLVGPGFINSLRAPGAAVAGVSLVDMLHSKRLELLLDAFPHVRTVAVLADRSWTRAYDGERLVAQAAQPLGLRATLLHAESASELDQLMQSPGAKAFDAWYVPATYIAYLAEGRIIEHLRRMRVPAIHATEQEVANGALMAYSQDTTFAVGALAELTGRIVAGETAGLIPIERPRRYVLSVRPRSEPLATQIAPSVVRRSDAVY